MCRRLQLLVLIVVFFIPQSAFSIPPSHALVGTWQITVFQDDGSDRLARLGAGLAKSRAWRTLFSPRTAATYLVRGDGRREVVAGLANAAWTYPYWVNKTQQVVIGFDATL